MPFVNNVEDITHHPKRTQADNILRAGTAFVTTTDQAKPENRQTDIPLNVTMESAIEYFRSHATGEYTVLYSFAADILERYRVAVPVKDKRKKSEPVLEVSAENEEED